MEISVNRISRATGPEGHDPQRVPVIEDDGMIEIDPWWGSIQPCQLHPDPDQALSDKDTQLPPERAEALLASLLRIRAAVCG